MSESLVILGASARAAAYSAARAGFSPWAADLFADADLARLCPVHRIDRFPCDIVAAARAAPPGAWIYTGGLENYPRLVERIAAERPLLGNQREPLRTVRDPWKLAAISTAAGLTAPELSATGENLPRDGAWLRKGLRSSGGLRVECWNEANAADPAERGWYFQARVRGDSYSGVFVAAGGAAVLLGITRQFIGGDSDLGDTCGAPPFHYAGSLGPIDLPDVGRRQLERLGETLASEVGLIGLFGVDFIWSENQVWPIEVNPRYPASVEVLERALSFSAVGWHVAACRECDVPASIGSAESVRVAGKAILYCRRGFTLSDAQQQELVAGSLSASPAMLADIPPAAGEFASGQPVVTLFEEGPTRAAVSKQLKERLRELRTTLL